MKYFYLILSLIGLILLGMLAFKATPTAKFGDAGVPNSLTSTTNSSIALTTNTSTLVLAANSGRLYASICSVPTNTTSTFITVSSAKNASGTVIGTPATLNNGVYIATGTAALTDTII